MIRRMGLRTVFLVIAALAAVLGAYVQIGRARATFEVWENGLQLDSDGHVSGLLTCGYRGPGTGEDHPWPLVFELHGVRQSTALTLRPGWRRSILFRYRPWWPLKPEDPFAYFVRHDLGIPADQIVGHVISAEDTQVVIRGH